MQAKRANKTGAEFATGGVLFQTKDVPNHYFTVYLIVEIKRENTASE
jgi:hypothetical protein